MNRIEDRKRQRREYLRKKVKVYADMVLTPLLPVCLMIWFFWQKHFWLGWLWLVSLLVGVPTFYVWWERMRLKEAKSIPHVPPVTPSTLPAE
jgi:hypothetical protein